MHIYRGHVISLHLRPFRCNWDTKDHIEKLKTYGIDWPALDALIAEFDRSTLPSVTIDVDTRWAEDMRAVVSFALKRLPRLAAERRLRFRFCRPRPSRRENDWAVWREEPSAEVAESDDEEDAGNLHALISGVAGYVS